jgi:cell division protein FtsW (lipid II flippase)
MIVLAHILGMPVEEYALPWISGGGAGMLIMLASGIRSLAVKRRMR